MAAVLQASAEGRNAEAAARLIAAIVRKRSGSPIESVDIEVLMADFLAGRTRDYQMAAWLATVACEGMSLEETVALTRAYVASGECLDLRSLGRTVVDKHSTGGVGDKVSIAVVPIVAACGVVVAKMSGRGLGYAGGTVDKLESIRGLRLDLSAPEVCALLRKVGMVITGQSATLAPGDHATYALRDVTGAVESIPLIAASIISKKVAVGADGLVLDVKTGSGALIPDRAMAMHLAETMLELGGRFGLRCRAVLTDMSQPLGYAVGNALEVKEALRLLRGETIPGLSELCGLLSRLMLQSAQPELSDEAADAIVARALETGAAHERFVRWATAQGADPRQLMNPDLLPTAQHRTSVCADRSGWVTSVDPRAIGSAALRLGAGRLTQSAAIDHAAGVLLRRRVGDAVRAGEPLAELHASHPDFAAALDLARSAFTIGADRAASRAVIHEVL